MPLLRLSLNWVEIVLILLVPLILELPRAILKGVFLLATRSRRRRPGPHLPSTPRVSIIVPAHNEGDTIETTLSSLIDLDYPEKEIIVVDDNSRDDTYAKTRPYARRGLVKLFRKVEPQSNKAMAVNYGALFASGELIVIIDADTIINRDSLIHLIEPFEEGDVVGVAGNVRVYNDRFLLGRIQAYEYLMAMELGRAFQSLLQILLMIPGAFGAFRARVFKHLGEMDEDTITEDFDFALKLRKTGGRILFISDAMAWTIAPDSWGAWFRQRIRWARGQVQTLRKHRDLILSLRYGVKAWLSTVDMLFMDIALLFVRFGWFISLPLLFPRISLLRMGVTLLLFYLSLELAQMAVAIAVSPRRKHDAASLPLLPLVVILYRPLYSLVRLYAYIQEALGVETRW